MKITDVKTIRLRSAGPKGHFSPQILVQVFTDEGITGIGAVDSGRVDPIRSIIEEDPPGDEELWSRYGRWPHMSYGLKHVLIGQDPMDVDVLWEKMYQSSYYYGRRGLVLHAMSGIDIALWDIIGKARDLPVYKLLGGSYRNRVRAYASTAGSTWLSGKTLAEAKKAAAQYLDIGYKAIKFALDLRSDYTFSQHYDRRDVEMVALARKTLGDDVDLMVDVCKIWPDVSTAIRLAKKFAEYNLFFLEEPILADDLDGFAQLKDAVPETRLAAGEEQTTRYDFKDLICRSKLDVVQPDICRVGGISEMKKIAAMAHAWNKLCIPHGWGTAANIVATLHVVASIPNAEFVEYVSYPDNPVINNLFKEPLEFEDGYVRVPEGPGLGVELDQETIKKYQY
jgi:L-alanine-DL-glutamate epimerase-like enolase superfamily enzyme